MLDELERYVQSQRAAGHTDEAMYAALLQAGWDPVLVEQAFRTATPSVDSTAAPPVGAAPRRSGRIVWLATVAVVSLGLIGLGVWLYNPTALANQALGELIQSETLTFDANVTVQGSADSASSGTLALAGAVDTRASQEKGAYTLVFDAPEQGLHGQLELRHISSRIYLKLQELSGVPLFDLSKLYGQWITVDLAELAQTSGYGEEYEGYTSDVTPEQVAQIGQAIQEAEILEVIGQTEWHLLSIPPAVTVTVQLNEERTVALAQRLQEILGVQEQDGLTRQEIVDGLSSVATAQQHFRVRAGLFGGLQELAFEQSVAEGQVVTGTIQFADLGSPVTVEQPPAAMTFEEAMGKLGFGELLEANLGEAQTNAHDARIQSDLNALAQAVSVGTTTSRSAFDTDGADDMGKLTSAILAANLVSNMPTHPVEGKTYHFSSITRGAPSVLDYVLFGELSTGECFIVMNGSSFTGDCTAETSLDQ